MESMRKRQLGQGCAEWFFSVWSQKSWLSSTVSVRGVAAREAAVFEEAEADALAAHHRQDGQIQCSPTYKEISPKNGVDSFIVISNELERNIT